MSSGAPVNRAGNRFEGPVEIDDLRLSQSTTLSTPFAEFEQFVHNTTWSGPWAGSETANIHLTRKGSGSNMEITLSIPGVTAAATTAQDIDAATALPARFRPTNLAQQFVVTVVNNSAQAVGTFLITPAGQMSWNNGVPPGSFANTGNAGWITTTVSYNTSTV